MNGILWTRLCSGSLRLRFTAIAVPLCVLITVLWGAGLREVHAGDDDTEKPEFATVDLRVTPASCVALHRGQVCFQRLQLRWKNPEGLRLCLFHQAASEALHCTAVSTALYRHEYHSDDSEVFTLREAMSGEVLATATVTTAWVYRTGKRSSSGWRLF